MSENCNIIEFRRQFFLNTKDKDQYGNTISLSDNYISELGNLKDALSDLVYSIKGAINNEGNFVNGYNMNFFQEILQNANDAVRRSNKDKNKTCRLFFSKDEQSAYTVRCCYEEEGFSWSDLFSLISENASGKTKEDGETGTFGIGIKSTWVFAREFLIESNVCIGFEWNSAEQNVTGTTIKYNDKWDRKTTTLTLRFAREDTSESTINFGKLCDFIDLLYNDNPQSAKDYLLIDSFDKTLAESWENKLFDLRMLLFTSEKNGIDTLEIYRGSEQNLLLAISCDCKKVGSVDVKTIYLTEENKRDAFAAYTLTHHEIRVQDEKKPNQKKDLEYIIALKVPEKLTNLDGFYNSSPLYFADFFVTAGQGSTPNILLNFNSTNPSRTEMKNPPQIKYQDILNTLIDAAVTAKYKAELDEKDRFACTKAICGIALSGAQWLPVQPEIENEQAEEYINTDNLTKIYVGAVGEKPIDKIFSYNSRPLNIPVSSITNNVLGLFAKLIAAHLPFNNNKRVLYIPKDKRSDFFKNFYLANESLPEERSSIANNLTADYSTSTSAEELTIFIIENKNKRTLLSSFPVALEPSGIIDLLEIKAMPYQEYDKRIYNAILGRCDVTGFDKEGMPTKAAVVDYLIKKSVDENEKEEYEEFNSLREAAQFSYFAAEGVRQKYTDTGYYYKGCSNPYNLSKLDKNSLMQLTSLLSFREVQERLVYVDRGGVMLSESNGNGNGLFSPPYLEKFQKSRNRSDYIGKNIRMINLYYLTGKNTVEMNFAEFKTIWDRLFLLAETYNPNKHYKYTTEIPSNVIGYFKQLTYQITDICLTDYIGWLCDSAERLAKSIPNYFSKENILNYINVTVKIPDNAESSVEYKYMAEFVNKHLLKKYINIDEVVILDTGTTKTMSGKCVYKDNSYSLVLYINNIKIENNVCLDQQSDKKKPLYIFAGSDKSNAKLHDRIIEALDGENAKNNLGNPSNFLKYFIHTGREYNVNSADFNTLVSGTQAKYDYLFNKLESYKSRIPDKSKILPNMVRIILCGHNSYDRHCPFCNSAFGSNIDGNESENALVPVIIPILTEDENTQNECTKFLPTIMCKACYKRFMHVTTASLADNSSTLTLEVSISDNCRKTEYTASVSLSPDNVSIYKKFNDLP